MRSNSAMDTEQALQTLERLADSYNARARAIYAECQKFRSALMECHESVRISEPASRAKPKRRGVKRKISSQPLDVRVGSTFGSQAVQIPLSGRLRLTRGRLEFLRKKYGEDPNNFFRRYGGPLGPYNLAHDRGETKGHLRDVQALLEDGDTLAQRLGVKDERFSTELNPNVILLKMVDMSNVREILRRSYQENPDRFYAVYGSPLGLVVLSKQLEREYKTAVAPQRLGTVIANPRKAQELSGIDDPNFAKRWRVKSIHGTLDVVVDFVAKLRTAYDADRDRFFTRYGCDVGAYNFAHDLFLQQPRGQQARFDLDLKTASPVMRDGVALSEILDVRDKRFASEWNIAQLNLSYASMAFVLRHLRTAYEMNADAFFERYGSVVGAYNIMRDLRANPNWRRAVTSNHISSFFIKGETLEKLLGLKDDRFLKKWKPRYFTANDRQIETVVEFLREKYTQDSDAFFERYGSTIGTLLLERDLVAEGKPHIGSCQLSSVTKDGEALEALLGVSDDRFRAWNPRSIHMPAALAHRVGGFMREQYNADPVRFFVRYGSRAGQYLLLKDLASRGISVVPIQLNGLANSPAAISALSGIPEKEFVDRWNPLAIYLSTRNIDRVADVLRKRYAADPDLFFVQYGSKEGFLGMIGELEAAGIKGHIPGTTNLLKHPELVAAITGIKDARLKSEWDVPLVGLGRNQLTTITDFLKDKYYTDQEVFFARYGSSAGMYHLACDLEKKGLVPRSMNLTELASIVGRSSIREIFGLNDPKFDEQWKPKYLCGNVRDARIVGGHLAERYSQDASSFFRRYGGALRVPILRKELEEFRVSDHVAYSLFVGNGTFVSEVIGKDDARFTQWTKSTYFGDKNREESTGVISAGLERMAEGCDLPDVALSSDSAYLRLRNELRMVDKDTTRYFVELYGKRDRSQIRRNIDRSVRDDRVQLDELRRIKTVDDVTEFGEEEFTNLAGKLLYSFDEEVRKRTGQHLRSIYLDFVNGFRMHVVPDSALDAVHEAADRYCTNFDLYNNRNEHRRPNFTFKGGLYSYLKTAVIAVLNVNTSHKTLSMDTPLDRAVQEGMDHYEVIS